MGRSYLHNIYHDSCMRAKSRILPAGQAPSCLCQHRRSHTATDYHQGVLSELQDVVVADTKQAGLLHTYMPASQ